MGTLWEIEAFRLWLGVSEEAVVTGGKAKEGMSTRIHTHQHHVSGSRSCR